MVGSAQTKYKLTKNGKLEKVETFKESNTKDTGYVLMIKDSAYNVYVSSKGKYFIKRVSAKTGKPYRKYITIE